MKPDDTAPEQRRAPDVPERVTTPLLTLLTQDSMDQGYRVAAERRRRRQDEGLPEPSPRRSALMTTVAVAIFGVLVAIAAVQTSRNADVEALGKTSLAERVKREQSSVRDLKSQAGDLLQENAKADAELRDLREREQQVTGRVSRLGVGTGYLAVQGPGLRITVDDPPDGTLTQAVQDEDLIVLVDGLWASGAEAIAINGQRLASLSSIQNTGSAIHVNVRPLTPPYVVEAIGDPDRMPARLLASTSGSLFYSVARTLGFVFDVQDDDNLELPEARVRTLQSAVLASQDQTSVEQEDEKR